MSEPIDLGLGHTLRFTSWRPDRRMNPQYKGIPDVDRIGAVIRHPLPDGSFHEGSLIFEGDVARRLFADRPMWTVVSWELLTLDPSVACTCGDHGHVRDGRWVPA